MASVAQLNLKITRLTAKINKLSEEVAEAKKIRIDLKAELKEAKTLEAAKKQKK